MDRVGTYDRERVALNYIDVLSKWRGRACAIAEMLRPQLRMYRGYRVSLSDGLHYLPGTLVEQLHRP